MKKTYITPHVEVQKISATQMICNSERMYSTDTSTAGFESAGKERGTRNGGDNFEDLW